ncbi:MAG: flagellar protein [Clostridia bacterium]|nr:flagellar protein [Clostridia bacterium]
MNIVNGQFPSIEQVTSQYLQGSNTAKKVTAENGLSFDEILKQKQGLQQNPGTELLKFSKHAALRLTERNIELSDDQIDRLNTGTQKAGEKGINESLVIVDQLAFIVNIKNNTVITAIDQNEANENVFTNIDGAVIV